MDNTVAHAVERKAFEVAIDAAIKHTNKDRQKALLQFIDLTEKKLGDAWKPEAYEALREIVRDKDSKWMRYIDRLFDNTDPKLIKMAALNLGYDAVSEGFTQQRKTQRNTDAVFRGFCFLIPQAPATCIVPDAGQQNTDIH